MSTVSIHIEGHEDGTLDDGPDLALVLRHIADELMNGASMSGDTAIPATVLTSYEGDIEEPAVWSIQHGRY